MGFGQGGYVTLNDSKAGGSRGFALRLPKNYDNSHPYWLIFDYHWNGGDAAQCDNGGTSGYEFAYYGLQPKSNEGAIFVGPDSIGSGWSNTNDQDLYFTDDMVKLISDNYCVDMSNLITTGFSWGGGMSYELACARANAADDNVGYAFRAAVIFEGAQLSGCDNGKDPIALWQMVGVTDTTCPVSLATPIRDQFVKNNGCTGWTSETGDTATPSTSGSTCAGAAPAREPSPQLEPGGPRLHELHWMLGRAPAPLVRAPVRSYARARRRELFRPISELRGQVFSKLPMHVDVRRCLDLVEQPGLECAYSKRYRRTHSSQLTGNNGCDGHRWWRPTGCPVPISKHAGAPAAAKEQSEAPEKSWTANHGCRVGGGACELQWRLQRDRRNRWWSRTA